MLKKFDGFVNGEIYLKQNNAVYQPTAKLTINELQINENALGKMSLDIMGNENFSKFEIDSKIENENFKSFSAFGNLQIIDKSAVPYDTTLFTATITGNKFNMKGTQIDTTSFGIVKVDMEYNATKLIRK